MCPPCISLRSNRMFLFEISIALTTPVAILDLESSFIENGGDSLSAMQLQAAFRRHGAHISLGCIFSTKTLLELSEHMSSTAIAICGTLSVSETDSTSNAVSEAAEIHPPKRLRRTMARDMTIQETCIARTRYPMTEMQKTFVNSSLKNPERNVISYFETHSTEDLPALRNAWHSVLRLEPIFRMEFVVNDTSAYMYERDEFSFIWEETLVEDEASYKRAVENLDGFDSFIGTKFDVVTLGFSKGATKSTVIWRVHHACIDGVSATILRSKVRKALCGDPITSGPSFYDFATQLGALQQRMQDTTVAFWQRHKQKHSCSVAQLLLPAPADRDPSHRSKLGQIYAKFDLPKLTKFCRREGVTLTSLYYAAWGLVLARYTDSDNICFGVVLSGRSLPIEGVESVVGPTINTLPLYISLNAQSRIREHIHAVFQSVLELIAFQWSTPAQGATRNFGTAVNVRPNATLKNSSDFSVPHPHTRVLSDIPIQVEIGNGGTICLSYDTEKFQEAHIERLSQALIIALELIMTHDTTVASFQDMFSKGHNYKELAQMGNWHLESTTHEYFKDDLVSLFTRTAMKYPYDIAVRSQSCSLTYAELDEQSSLIAYHMSRYVGPGDVVCVHADRTINWIVAIYGTLKAGAVYCPLDQDFPDVIRKMNYESANARIFVTGSFATKKFKPASADLCFCVEEWLEDDARKSIDLHDRETLPERNAYLCFTSGSTGRPKGVMCRHRGLVAFQKDFTIRLHARPGWKIAQFMSPGFDGSIHEIFSALSYGSTLILKDPSNPLSHLKTADAAILTPTWAKALDVDEFPQLKTVYLVGEVVPQSICDTWGRKKKLFNMYGPTEATCGATIKELRARSPVTLGTLNPTTRAYILDNKQRLVPWGVIGTLYLAGVQVSAGYLGQSEETASKFLPDMINPQYISESMYKTGDRAYWTEDGELMFLGRADRQIKLHGFRVDLDDLEIRIAQAHKCCTAAAVALQNGHLVALIQPGNIEIPWFKSLIHQQIPGYALPRYILAVNSFPTTTIGKIDYKAIAAMVFSDEIPNVKITTLETSVISAFKEVLGMPNHVKVDPETSLNDIGMDSMNHLCFMNRLSRALGKSIPLRTLLNSGTIRQLVQTLECSMFSSHHSSDNELGESQISPIEKDWWHKYNRNSDTSSFNVTYACQLSKSVDRRKIAESWNSVISRYGILRCRYRKSGCHVIQREYAQMPTKAKLVDTLHLSNEANVTFDLARDDLIRVFISQNRMLVVISHIICDLTTLKVLLLEVADVYNGKEAQGTKKTYFQTIWSKQASPLNLSFWTSWLSNPPNHKLSIGNSTSRLSWSGTSHVSKLPEHLYPAMLRFGSANRISMHQLALAAIALVLQHNRDDCDIIIGAPYLNRHSEEDSKVVGLFLEPLPIRIQYPYSISNSQESDTKLSSLRPPKEGDTFVQAVKRYSRAALSHAVPWGQLLSHLNIQTDFPNHPLFDTMVTFHDADHEIMFPIDGVEFVPTWTNGAKFKLMAEFTAQKTGDLNLRLEYSNDCFSMEDVEQAAHLTLVAIESIISEDTFEEALYKIRSFRNHQ